ncbi:MAG TPA: rhodanese-like domain-containing protein [Bryobacteraceae bacterium]|nr:rhodanese-like domain-containing protein [Bryobacteraceae bacterium]
MNETVQFLEQHGYWLLIGAVLGRQACLPIPANLFLVAAGALARSGKASVLAILGLSVMTFLVADLAWFEAGRRFGDKILHFVCGLSGEPVACVNKATGAFHRHGVRSLLVSKFILGVDAVAAPLAGAASTPPLHFLAFDALGATFWTGTYVALGYIFSNQLERVAHHLVRMGAFIALAVIVACGFYMVRKLAAWIRFVRQFKLARITPEELNNRLKRGEDILIVDLQGRTDHAREAMAIPGAVRIDPRRLEKYKDQELSPSQEVVLYCACPGEYTSARVALALRQKGVKHVRPLAGGLKAWRDRGFPVTATVRSPSSPVAHG